MPSSMHWRQKETIGGLKMLGKSFHPDWLKFISASPTWMRKVVQLVLRLFLQVFLSHDIGWEWYLIDLKVSALMKPINRSQRALSVEDGGKSNVSLLPATPWLTIRWNQDASGIGACPVRQGQNNNVKYPLIFPGWTISIHSLRCSCWTSPLITVYCTLLY